jgi:hypothetical protein
MIKKSNLLKSGCLAKKENSGLLERKKHPKHHLKQCLSTSKNQETTSVAITGIDKISASTPNLNPYFPGINSSDK